MNASKKKRLSIVAAATLGAAVVYLAAYYVSVTVYFRHPFHIKEQGIESAYANYKVGERCQGLAQALFEPARLFDSYYIRPALWSDKVHKPGR